MNIKIIIKINLTIRIITSRCKSILCFIQICRDKQEPENEQMWYNFKKRHHNKKQKWNFIHEGKINLDLANISKPPREYILHANIAKAFENAQKQILDDYNAKIEDETEYNHSEFEIKQVDSFKSKLTNKVILVIIGK